MKQLIVNADDFGLSNLVNKGILHCFNHGILSSTSLMANSEGFENATEIAKKFKLKVGVHLNLTTGKSLTKQSSLTGPNNSFLKHNIKMILLRKINLNDVKNELKMQIERVNDYGLRPTHLDGHQHVHILPGVVNIIIELAKEFNIKKVRLPFQTQTFIRTSFKRRIIGLIINHYALKAKKCFQKNSLKFPEHFYGLYETGSLNTEKLKNFIINLNDGITEIMCHPGYHDPNLKLKLKSERVTELKALTSPIIKNLVKRHNIKLINFNKL